MKRVLVIAVTRLGDLIQTEPMFRALKAEGRADHLTVLAERSFAEIAERLECVDRVCAIDFADVLGTLGSNSRTLPLSQYAGLYRALSDTEYDEVWNVTHSRPSMVLTALARANKRYGVTLDSHGMQIVRNEWITYFFAANLARPWCAHNLVDIYVNAVSLQTPFDQRIPHFESATCKEPRLPRRELRGAQVLLHPGASQPDKRWPSQRFSQVANWLKDRGAEVVLIGGRKELKLETEFPLGNGVRSLIGKTSVAELFSLCADASFMVTCDSGPVHIAAAAGLPVVAIEGGSAHGFETAPYGERSLVLQPHLQNLMTRSPGKSLCSDAPSVVQVQDVTKAIELLIGERDSLFVSNGVSAYQTGRDERTNGLNLTALATEQPEYERALDQLKLFWFHALSRISFNDSSARGGLGETFGENMRAARSLGTTNHGARLLEIKAEALKGAEQNLKRKLMQEPRFHHLQAFLQIARGSLSGDTLEQQANELADLYARLGAASECLTAASCSSTKQIQNSLEIEVTA
ncbi:MAG: glycosyltransferase family 9 protein [Calditrichaeota bacterium]|nr:glycosyltransferase family 9 protein [Calditrichota bacterium]MCB9366008.1 glycosyltransferase family 9 protein [Calditrichota bacterium]MCB9391866.1 glycosyltransferase family 9 protein [Calditrichota bacterium]